MLYDIHTHNLAATDAVINLPEGTLPEPPGDCVSKCYSVGIHPWQSEGVTPARWGRIENLASEPGVVAIGETGIDRLRGADVETQTALFRRHALLAESVRKPLIIHNVRATDLLLRIRREIRPSVPWIVHGYRGGATQARQLLDAGLLLSFGARSNPAAIDLAKAIAPERCLVETDESELPIAEIANRNGLHLRDLTPLLQC